MTAATPPASSPTEPRERAPWAASLAQAIRDPEILITRLGLADTLREPARAAARHFPVMVPESYLARMRPGDPHDPLLLQVLPLAAEDDEVPGFQPDAVGDHAARSAPGLLHKYAGRVLLVTTGACAVHCRYCFRRHYPYGEEPRRMSDWEPAFEAIAADDSIDEVILSGGDPLMLTDQRLAEILSRLEAIPHLARIRFHSRLPIVLPDRITDDFLQLLQGTRLQPIFVVHANHPAEIEGDCRDALTRLVRSGIPTLNQAVLLRGVNDRAEVLEELSRKLINAGVMPYYLHQLDRVAGAAHFEVDEREGLSLIEQLRERLPGYGVPQYVRERSGEASKTPIVNGSESRHVAREMP
ncbi:L-lysine 2,3-aminomutase [Planctomyces sp. SH-PL14]|nr:EF-P beta-lysylation protein EpmB [Planctomyces sp. SH-PL14]AMV17034.1 L-lysine 2,3-aminomutase [Planctomyces sp. SH-PL14]